MRLSTKSEVEKIISRYDADNDCGPDAPVTWREERLANAVLELEKEVEQLEARVSAIIDRLEGRS